MEPKRPGFPPPAASRRHRAQGEADSAPCSAGRRRPRRRRAVTRAAREPRSRSTEQPQGRQHGAEARLSPSTSSSPWAGMGGTGAGPFLSLLPSLRGSRGDEGTGPKSEGRGGGLWKAGGATGTASFPAAFPLPLALPTAGGCGDGGLRLSPAGQAGPPWPPQQRARHGGVAVLSPQPGPGLLTRHLPAGTRHSASRTVGQHHSSC